MPDYDDFLGQYAPQGATPEGATPEGATAAAPTADAGAGQGGETPLTRGFTPSYSTRYPTIFGSYQEMIRSILGRYVIADFLIGTSLLEKRAGMITDVGPGFFTLQDPCTGTHTACDLFSLKFLTILPQTETTEEALCTFQIFSNI